MNSVIIELKKFIERLMMEAQRKVKHRDKEMKNMKEMLRFREEKIKGAIGICR